MYRHAEHQDCDTCATLFFESSLNTIVVKESEKGRGIGGELLHSMEAALVSFKWETKVFLTVATINHTARAFYNRNGYKEIGEVPDLYVKGVNEKLMYKEISYKNNR